MGWNIVANVRGPQGAPGAAGAAGPKGDPGPVGPAGLVWRGAWSNANAYAVNDAVGWGGSSYFATVAKAAGSPPPTGTAADPGTDDNALNAGWALLSVQGATGPQGNAGPQGNPGAKGDAGAPGATGTRGSQWFVGDGAPPAIVTGSIPGDKYLDRTTGDVYDLT